MIGSLLFGGSWGQLGIVWWSVAALREFHLGNILGLFGDR